MKAEGEVGKPLPRIDALEKATGLAAFTTDLKLPGMLHAKVLRSPYPHARKMCIRDRPSGFQETGGVSAGLPAG